MTEVRKYKFDTPLKNVDEFAIRDNLHLLQDMIYDEAFSLQKRFGGSFWVDFSITAASCQGLFWWSELNVFIAVIAGQVFKITDSNGTYVEITNSVTLSKDVRATFTKVADQANSLATTLFIGVQNQVVYTVGGNCSQFTTGLTGTTATTVSHVASLDTYLMVNDLDNKNRWLASEPGTPFVWTSKQEVTAQAKSDSILGIFQNKNNIFACGEDSIEPFYNSGTATPWLRINGGLIEPGIANPYAFSFVGNTPVFFNSSRDFATISGNNSLSLSAPYSRRIQGLSSVNDVEIDVMNDFEGKKLVLLHFRDAGVTLCYDFGLRLSTGKDIFYEFGWWNAETSKHEHLRYRCYAYSPEWNMSIMGDRENSKLYKVSFDVYEDNGNPIASSIESGIYGNPAIETACNDLIADIRRGDGMADAPYTAPKAYLEYRDNNEQSWSNRRILDLGAKGDTKRNTNQYTTNNYYTRQFKISHMDNSPFVLNGLWEKVDIA